MYNARRYGKICPYCNMKVQEESAATKPLGFEPPVELLPGDAAGLAYLNEEAVYVPTELKPYDTISLGNSRFLFVPLCGTNFSWEDVK